MNARTALRRAGLIAAATVVAAASLLGSGAHAATASGAAAASDQQLRVRIKSIVDRAPGARVIAPNKVEVQPGLVVTVDRARGVSAQVEPLCPQDRLCIYEHRFFNSGTNGESIEIWQCGNYDLGKVPHGSGGMWNDRISSIANRQTGSGATAAFYNYSGRGNVWHLLDFLDIDHNLPNLAVQKTYNDKIDGVHNCGSSPTPWRPTSDPAHIWR